MTAKTQVEQAEWIQGVALDGTVRIEKTVGHGLKDAQGRMIGSVAVVLPLPGGRAACVVQSTRNGEDFGATAKYKAFKSVEAAKSNADAAMVSSVARTHAKANRPVVAKKPQPEGPTTRCVHCASKRSKHLRKEIAGEVAWVCHGPKAQRFGAK